MFLRDRATTARNAFVNDRRRRLERLRPGRRRGSLDRPDAAHKPRVIAQLDLGRCDEQHIVLRHGADPKCFPP
jgi:hypothetical protein